MLQVAQRRAAFPTSQLQRPFRDLFHRPQSPDAFVAAGQHALVRPDELRAALFQRLDIFLRRGVPPHFPVHRRRDQDLRRGIQRQRFSPQLNCCGDISALHLIRSERCRRRVLALIHPPDLLVDRQCVSIVFGIAIKLGQVHECLRIGIALSEALDFLHRQGMTHRDIKPQNIIFINGQPKLADLGLITDIRSSDQVRTLVGTPGYMPPPPERPGTAQADIYALGVMLYVISTGGSPAAFPAIATTLVSGDSPEEFFPLNDIILKACQPMPADRYASAAEMRLALQTVLRIHKTQSH